MRLSGELVQTVTTQTGAIITGTAVAVIDDNIPASGWGDTAMTLAVTPTAAGNTLEIEVCLVLTNSAAGQTVAALFRDSGAAIAVASQYQSAATGFMTITFKHYVAAGSTSATTFRVATASNTGGTVSINGQSGNRRWGGVSATRITVRELKA